MKNLFIFCVAMVICCINMNGQTKHGYTLDFEKKIIYVDSLKLPDNTSVEIVLQTMPELLVRPGENLNGSYNVKVNDLSLGSLYEEVLGQLRVSDVEKIEISGISCSSYARVGSVGEINIVLRNDNPDKSDNAKKTWGSAELDMFYPLCVSPNFQIKYKNDKFSLSGLGTGLFAKNSNESTQTNPISTATYNNHNLQGREMAEIFAKWTPTKKDIFEFRFAEHYGYAKDNQDSRSLEETKGFTYSDVNDTTKTTSTYVKINYEHHFLPSTWIVTEHQYDYNKSVEGYNDNSQLYTMDSRSHAVYGTLHFNQHLFYKDPQRYGTVRIGADYNYSTNKTQHNNAEEGLVDKPGFENRNTCVTPFLRWTMMYNKFSMKAHIGYQLYYYRIGFIDSELTNINQYNVTGFIQAQQEITPNHVIRFFYERKLKRPSLTNLYPYIIVIPTQQLVSIGNPDLQPTVANILSLDYITYYRKGFHDLTVNIGASYERDNDIIRTINTPSMYVTGYNVHTYANADKADVFSVDLMAKYRYRYFSVTLTGRLYNSTIKSTNADTEHITYGNISIMPAFMLPSGWNSSLYLAYFSRIKTASQRLGDIGTVDFSVGKKIGRWDPYFYLATSFTGDVTDTTYGSAYDTELIHPLLQTQIGVGIRYNF